MCPSKDCRKYGRADAGRFLEAANPLKKVLQDVARNAPVARTHTSMVAQGTVCAIIHPAPASTLIQESEDAVDRGIAETNKNHPFHKHGMHGVPSKAHVPLFDAAQDVL